VLAHGGVQGFFSSVPEGRVAEVVDKGECFGEIHVEAKGSGDGAGDLSNLKRVSQAVAEVIAVAAGENLRLGLKAAEGARMDDAVSVPLKVVAVGVLRFGEAASTGAFDVHRVGGEHVSKFIKVPLFE